MEKKSRVDRGVALLMALFALLLLSAIGLGLMYMADTETGVNSNFRTSQQAYYAAKAGVEEGRERLRSGSSNWLFTVAPNAFGGFNNLTVMPSTTTANGVVYIINQLPGETVQPWVYSTSNKYFDDELCHENYQGLYGTTTFTPAIPCTAAPSGTYYTTVTSTDPGYNTSAAMNYKWVRITLKQVGSSGYYCSNGPGTTCASASTQVCATSGGGNPSYFELPNPLPGSRCEASNLRPVFTITSLAVTPGGSRRMTQYEAAAIAFPVPPSPLTLDGSSPSFVTGNSAVFKANGNDACGVTAPVPGVGTFDTASTATMVADIGNNQCNYTGAGGSCPTPPVPSVQNVNSQLGALSTVGGLQALQQNLIASADQYFPPGSPSTLGTAANPLITVVNGDFTLGGSTTGNGILLVTGTLTMNGNPTWNGIIFVIGTGSVVKNGGGNGTIDGALFVANLYNSSGQPLPASSAPGVPSMTWNGGGTANIDYNSCMINQMSNRVVVRALASREEIY